MATKPPPIARKPKNKLRQFRAMYDYEGQEQEGDYTVLKFEEGDIITWLEDIDENWIKARVNNQEGIVPKEFVDERASQVFPLHEACRRGNLDQVKQYIQDRIPVNQPDKVNGTPIYYAAQGGSMEVIDELLATTYIDFKPKNNMGESCLHVAAVKGFADVCRRLVEYNQSLLNEGNALGKKDLVSAQNKMGKTAEQLAYDPRTKAYLQEQAGAFQDKATHDSEPEYSSEDEED